MNVKLENKLKELPKSSGVYLFRNKEKRIIYVGKAVNLRNRVGSYFHGEHDSKTVELVKNIVNLEWIEVSSEFEALVFEADLIKRYKPKYNIRFRDDKNYAYIKISGEDWPRISVVHQIVDHTSKYLGPFTETSALKSILKLARHIFPYCTCNLPAEQVCLYYHLGLCPGHGEKYISKKDYAKNIKGLTTLFSGKTQKVETELKKAMKTAAQKKEFERAAEYRDKLHYVLRIEKSHLFSDRELATDAGLRELSETLSLTNLPKRIECFDISNIMGTAAVGSMVVFKNGIASPRDYRRFKIKTVKVVNDFASMAEVLMRRFKMSKTKSKDESFRVLPNLVILDGGKGQLSTVLKNVTIPADVTVVALAKRFEEIVKIENCKLKIVNLPKQSEALYLVQRIRDEAHRFAITYHRKLKGKELFETSLDAILGIGPKTKKKLLREFGSIKRIKEASFENLSQLVGEKIAQKIKEEL